MVAQTDLMVSLDLLFIIDDLQLKDSAFGRSYFMKTGKKNLLLAVGIIAVIAVIGIIAVIAVIMVNSHNKYSAFVAEFDYPTAQARGLPMLVEFGSQACPPCKMMIPVLKSLNKEHSEVFAIGYIDVIKERAEMRQYNIEATPTLIFYDKDGKELYRHLGHLSARDILSKWKELGFFSN